LLQHLCSLGEVLNVLHLHVWEKLPSSLTTDVQSFKADDQVWIRVKSPASPASVEGTLFGEPDYPHGKQDGENHPMDPSQLS
jgi:hypothetical protein